MKKNLPAESGARIAPRRSSRASHRTSPKRLVAAAAGTAVRSDVRFAWAKGDESLDAWRTALADWAEKHINRQSAVWVGNTVLDYLREYPSVTRLPQEFCSQKYTNPHPLSAWLERGQSTDALMANRAHAFFAWYLDRHLTLPDDYGRPVLAPGHWNPLVRQRSQPHPSQTAREALPTRLIRELLAVLRDDDWAWSRSQAADTVKSVDATTRAVTRRWCPVRASALALKLLLPLRTFQVRMLESGEGDSERYVDGDWKANTSPHAPSRGVSVRRGALRAFRDGVTGSVTTGFFVNTNKTADRQAAAGAGGYDIPWQHDDAIAVVDRLSLWQETHNPVAGPLAWSELHDKNVRMASVERGESAYFLMRDPNGKHRNEPVSDNRLRELWHRLVAELEDRMNARGERLADGSPIRLVELVRTARGDASRRSLYDLHSLRVSLLTALATDGGVPLHMLSKCIAGHASVVMTLYYVKNDPAAMTKVLTEATARIDHASQEQFARYLKSEARRDHGFVLNDPTGITALDRSAPASWIQLDTGICPVGGTRCGEGGPAIKSNLHGPAPGGIRNCVRCRFHVTGPAFLGGLVARFNAVSLRLDSAKRECQEAERHLTGSKERRYEQEKAGVFQGAEVARAHDRLDRAQTALQTHTGNLQAVAVLVERCKAVASSSDGFGLNLVLGGTMSDFTTAVRLTSDFALLDAVCQAATVHPCEEASEATLRRSQALDRALVRHGRAPAFMHLSDSDALTMGNEMMRLMTASLGRERAVEVIAQPTALLEADVALHVNALLASLNEGKSRALTTLAQGAPVSNDEARA